MHVSTLAHMLNVLQLLVSDLHELLYIVFCIIHFAQLCNRILLHRVNIDYSN